MYQWVEFFPDKGTFTWFTFLLVQGRVKKDSIKEKESKMLSQVNYFSGEGEKSKRGRTVWSSDILSTFFYSGIRETCFWHRDEIPAAHSRKVYSLDTNTCGTALPFRHVVPTCQKILFSLVSFHYGSRKAYHTIIMLSFHYQLFIAQSETRGSVTKRIQWTIGLYRKCDKSFKI